MMTTNALNLLYLLLYITVKLITILKESLSQNLEKNELLAALLGNLTSKHQGGSYCLNCFYSFRTDDKRK